MMSAKVSRKVKEDSCHLRTIPLAQQVQSIDQMQLLRHWIS